MVQSVQFLDIDAIGVHMDQSTDPKLHGEVALPELREDVAAADFTERLRTTTPYVWVTPTIIVANVAVFIAMVVGGAHWMDPTVAQLLEWGANYRPMTASGDWWRLLTSTFVHIGIVHLLFNMVVLGQAGPMVERLLGNGNYLVLYLLSGLAGSLLSAFWHADITSAGASGAVFGVYGALIGFLLRHKAAIPKTVLSSVGKGAALFIGFNLLYGFSPGVDMAGHVGGLIGGFLLALVIPNAYDGNGGVGRTAAIAVVGLGLVAAGVSALPKSPDMVATIDEVVTVEARVLDRYNAIVIQAQAGTLPDAEMATIIEQELLPDWSRVRENLDEVVAAGTSNKKLGLMATYMLAREEGWTAMVLGLRSGDPAKFAEGKAHQQRAEEMLPELSAE
ncbi:MAG: rhomboid protease GluP [Myxococcota bacterium]